MFHLFLSHNSISLCLKLNARLNARHYFIIKIPNKSELQKTALHYSFEIDFEDFVNLNKDYTKEPSSFLVNDTTLSSHNSLRFRKKLL